MAETLPAIRVTDPQSQTASPVQSPQRDSADPRDYKDYKTPSSRGSPSRDARPATSNGITSPGKLLRSLSNTVSNQATNGQAASNSDATNGQDGQSAMDPLSQHILNRTSTGGPTSSGLWPATPATSSVLEEKKPDDLGAGFRRAQTPPVRNDTGTASQKEKKKGVSFLSRFIGSNKKKDVPEDASDAGSMHSEVRLEGTQAQVFSQPVDNIEYNPRHPQPPAYIKVRARHKKDKDFDRMFLAQELHGTERLERKVNSSTNGRRRNSAESQDTIWAMEFSKDGKYLAAAGQDKILRIWAVLSTAEERRAHEQATVPTAEHPEGRALRLSAPAFQSKPIREYEGHTSTILDISWSKNNFLLSSSMDKTVRLWHVSRTECLCTFKHNDFVPSIAFHPRDDRFFLAGSLDSKLRLWSIPDKTVAYWNQLPDMITAVAFTPDGKHAMAGCLSGLCMFYETEGLKYQTQIHVRSTHGKNAKGSKITGIQAVYHPPGSTGGDIKLLISSNDSRVRLYNFRDKSMEIKFKGNENNCSQIRACLSDDARYVASGSEDNKAYIWSLTSEEGEKRDKRPMEIFDANDTITTCVAFAPTRTKQVLSKSEDPIYDLCNPPPVTLMSRAERAESQSSSQAPDLRDGDSIRQTPPPTLADPDLVTKQLKRLEESPAYVTRSSHVNGNIIVTADFSGRLKVFRQDCAWSKRRADTWETSSVFSKRSRNTNRGLGRSGSVATKASSRSLLSTNRQDPGRDSASIHGPSDRILSWRQGIANSPSIRNGSIKSGRTGKAERSLSPRKSFGQFSAGSTQTRQDSSAISLPQTQAQEAKAAGPDTKSQSTPELNDDNPLLLSGGRSNLFYKPLIDARASGHTVPAGGGLHVPRQVSRRGSVVSQLSLERSSGDGSISDDVHSRTGG